MPESFSLRERLAAWIAVPVLVGVGVWRLQVHNPEAAFLYFAVAALIAVIISPSTVLQRIRHWGKRTHDMSGLNRSLVSLLKRHVQRVDPDLTNPGFRYKRLRFEASVEEGGDFRACYRYWAIHKTERPVTDLMLGTIATSGVSLDNMNMRVVDDDDDGREFLWTAVQDSPMEKKIRVPFQPLQPSQMVKVRSSFLWPKVMMGPGDMDWVDLSCFEGGVDRVEFQWRFERRLGTFQLVVAGPEEEEQVYPVQPVEETARPGEWTYQVAIDNPPLKTYYFSYLYKP